MNTQTQVTLSLHNWRKFTMQAYEDLPDEVLAYVRREALLANVNLNHAVQAMFNVKGTATYSAGVSAAPNMKDVVLRFKFPDTISKRWHDAEIVGAINGILNFYEIPFTMVHVTDLNYHIYGRSIQVTLNI